MLRKSPYVSENYEKFYTKEWDLKANSQFQNSQETLHQAQSYIQNLNLDQNENQYSFDFLNGKRQFSDIVGKQTENSQNINKQTLKRMLFTSGFDECLLNSQLNLYTAQNIRNSSTPFAFCSYCHRHFDEILILKQNERQNSHNQNPKISNSERIDSFFISNPKYNHIKLNKKEQLKQNPAGMIQMKLSFNQSVDQIKLEMPDIKGTFNFPIQFNEKQDREASFIECIECQKIVCFKCCKKCDCCEENICPLPLCQSITYELNQYHILCYKCSNFLSMQIHLQPTH